MKATFIRFLNLKHTMEVEPSDLDLTSIKLLEICELKSYKNQRLSVSAAMNLKSISSPATIHRKLNQLIDAGYLTLEYEGKNKRTKFLTPTQKSHDYFTKLGKLITLSSS